MKTYTVTMHHTARTGESRPLRSQQVTALTAGEAIAVVFPDTPTVSAPDEDIAEWIGENDPNGGHVSITAEPVEPEYGALREAIATAATLERALEQAIEQLARIAELPQDTAYTCLLALEDWTPGQPITDEQCKAFIETPQEADAE